VTTVASSAEEGHGAGRRDVCGGRKVLPSAPLRAAARSPYFRALFKSGKGMHEEGSRAAGKDIVITDVSTGSFHTLLRFLFTRTLPEEEDCGEGLAV